MNQSPPRRRGFTIIELLVVVAILVLLIGILIPALGRAKTTAYNAQSDTILTQLSNSVEAYYQAFQAYPGPATVNDTSGAPKKLSGSQNLLVALAYTMNTNVMAAPFVPFGTGSVDPTHPDGPTNLGSIRADGTAEKLPRFFDVSAKLLSKGTSATAWPDTGVTGPSNGTGNSFKFPVIVDAFPDALPILYYRRTPGIDKPTGQTTVVGVDSTTNPGYAYYWAENKEYTKTASLQATSGAICPQDKGTMFDQNEGKATLAALVENASGTSGVSARGGFVLIHAGIDRIYGKAKLSNGSPGASDDAVRIGGN